MPEINYQEQCARLLTELRLSSGTSKEQMAAALGVDRKTYMRYEAGTSAPSLPAFLCLFSELQIDAMSTMLSHIYPDKSFDADGDSAQLRDAAVHYMQHVASDHEIREISYLIFGGHGSSWRSQLEEFTMLEHLPLTYRVAIAGLIDEFYTLANQAGHLADTDHVMPDVDIFRSGLSSGREAAYCGSDRYTILK